MTVKIDMYYILFSIKITLLQYRNTICMITQDLTQAKAHQQFSV